MDLRSLIEKIDAIESSVLEQTVANPYTGADAQKFAAMTPADQEWLTRGGGVPDINDQFILARAPNKGRPAQQPVVQQPVSQQPPAQSGMPAVDLTALLAKLKQLEQLVDKYNTLKPKTESAISIEQALVESFGYAVHESFMLDSVKKIGGKLFSKIAFPVAAGLAIWTGWTEIKELSPSLTDQQRRAETTKIISKLVAEFGTFYVGAILGGAIVGAITGPGAIVGFIAGGVASSILLGNDVDSIVNKVVDYLYKDTPPSTPVSTDAAADPAASNTVPAKPATNTAKGDPDVVELQTGLKKSGATNSDGSPLTVDGIMGPNTITAMQKELAGLGATNQDGTPLTIDGKLGPNTAAAMQKYYLS